MSSDFFFFQAEDGIRDLTVTGFRRVLFRSHVEAGFGAGALDDGHRPWRVDATAEGREHADAPVAQLVAAALDERSEERRVGKECRSRWSQYHEKKKINPW